jgi:hypothetical protein
MCFGKSTPAPAPAPIPEVVKPVDPQVAADTTAAEAAAKANADGAQRTVQRRKSALATGAGMKSASALSSGKATLGQ